jgi:hypothetical protein
MLSSRPDLCPCPIWSPRLSPDTLRVTATCSGFLRDPISSSSLSMTDSEMDLEDRFPALKEIGRPSKSNPADGWASSSTTRRGSSRRPVYVQRLPSEYGVKTGEPCRDERHELGRDSTSDDNDVGRSYRLVPRSWVGPVRPVMIGDRFRGDNEGLRGCQLGPLSA